jgi:hypothetical protein
VDGNAATVTKPLKVSTFKDDVTPPRAVAFEINMNDGTFTMIYEQPVLGNTLNTTTFTFQERQTNPLHTHTLTGGSAEKVSSTHVKITLNSDDLNEIKRTPICANRTRRVSCFLRFSDSSVLDARRLPVKAVSTIDTSPIASQKYTRDSTPPELVEFTSLDLNNGQITIAFTETIDRASAIADSFVIRASPIVNAAVQTYTLRGLTAVSSQDGTKLTYNISDVDLNAVKQNTRLCTTIYDCYMSVKEDGVLDMSANGLVASNEGYMYVQSLSVDRTHPSLSQFSIDMDAKVLSLTFDETVKASSLKPNFITLQSNKTGGSNVPLTFTAQSLLTKDDGLVMEVQIDVANMNEIKRQQFCSNEKDTFVSLTRDTIVDMTEPTANPANAVPSENAMIVRKGGYKGDRTRPRIGGFGLDLDLSLITLYFNEPVMPSSLNTSAMILQAAKGSNHTLRLTGGIIKQSAPAMSHVIVMVEADVVALKSNPALGTSKSNVYLSADDGAMKDVAGLETMPLSSIPASSYNADDRLGSCLSFTIDLEARELVLVFNEIINTELFQPKQITIQSHEDIADASASHTLNSSKTRSPDGRTVVISLSDEDLLAMGKTDALAISADNSFLQMNAAAFEDMFGRNVLALTVGKAKKASKFVPDTTAPAIKHSHLNLTSGTLSLSFSEAINTSSFDVTDIKVQEMESATNSSLSTNLTGADNVVFADDAQSLVIYLLTANLNDIKLHDNLATSIKNTFVTYSASLVADLADVRIISRVNGLAISAFTKDTRSPSLVAFDINMDLAVITLEYDETVRALTSHLSKLLCRAMSTIQLCQPRRFHLLLRAVPFPLQMP